MTLGLNLRARAADPGPMDITNPLVWAVLVVVAAAFIIWVRRQDRNGPMSAVPGHEAAGASSNPPSILDLMQRGRKIEAIKLYREEHGVGLREAKEAVEALADGHAVSPSR